MRPALELGNALPALQGLCSQAAIHKGDCLVRILCH